MPYRPMDAAWWSNYGNPARWPSTWEGYAITKTYTVATGGGWPGWLRIGLSPGTDINGTTTFFQAPFSVGGVGPSQQSEDNYDTGFFYLQVLET